jgi:hypothetical protein
MRLAEFPPAAVSVLFADAPSKGADAIKALGKIRPLWIGELKRAPVLCIRSVTIVLVSIGCQKGLARFVQASTTTELFVAQDTVKANALTGIAAKSRWISGRIGINHPRQKVIDSASVVEHSVHNVWNIAFKINAGQVGAKKER